MKYSITIYLLGALALAGCSSTQNQNTTPTPEAVAPIAGDTSITALTPSWRLTQLGSQEITTTEDTPTIGFSLEERRVFGFNGCNRYFGSIKELRPGKMEFGILATTMMACPPEGLEGKFMHQINQTKQFRTSGDTLYLLDAEGKKLLTFERTEGEP